MINLLAKPVVEEINASVKKRVARFVSERKRAPKLVVILVGDNPASVIYTSRKGAAAAALGMEHETLTFPDDVLPAEVRQTVHRLNVDKTVDGILIQRPLPPAFKEDEVLYWVDPTKDVDAFHPENAGRLLLGLPCLQPCTPTGVMEILRHYDLSVDGKLACVIGRSSIVGKPMTALLMHANATVTVCHSRTPDLAARTREADLIVAAIGKPGLVTAKHVKPGAIVVDVGINRTADGKVVGDVLYPEVSAVASAITPVPGGVGPMTIAILLRNTITAAEAREAAHPHLFSGASRA